MPAAITNPHSLTLTCPPVIVRFTWAVLSIKSLPPSSSETEKLILIFVLLGPSFKLTPTELTETLIIIGAVLGDVEALKVVLFELIFPAVSLAYIVTLFNPKSHVCVVKLFPQVIV